MLIAYVTIDEVNEDLALQLTAACSACVEVLWPRDGAPDNRFAAVIYDLDSLPPGERAALLSELTAGPPPRPVAVHSYRLEDEESAALQANGVAVYCRLDEVFRQTVEAARVAVTATLPRAEQSEANTGLGTEVACEPT